MVIVLSTLPDREGTERIAHALVDQRLAACVSILAPATSVYRWGGAVETAQEWPVLIKTPAKRLPALQQALYPYEVPEIVALDVSDALPAYLRWALESCAPSPTAPAAPGKG